MTEPTNEELAEALRSIEGLPLGTRLIVRLAADRLCPPVVIADGEGWIEWSGGECPVDKEAIVECKFDIYPRGPESGTAKYWRWETVHEEGWRNIIAYRVVGAP